ncbi:MAG: hypothetical protein WCX46_03725 [Candidatus Paceibacterota bacterium]
MKKTNTTIKTGLVLILISLFFGILTEAKAQVTTINAIGDTATNLNSVNMNYSLTMFGCDSVRTFHDITTDPFFLSVVFQTSYVGRITSGTYHEVASLSLTQGAIYYDRVRGYKYNSGSFTGIVTSNIISFTAPTNTCVASITADSSTTFCQGGNVILSSTHGNSYQWYVGIIPLTGETDSIIVVSSSGNYSCHTTMSCGTVITNSISVTINSLPTATITGNTGLGCTGITTLTANGGNSYHWSNGANTQSITVTTPGTYKVTATNNCGSDSTSVIVTSTTTTIQADLSIGDTILCPGQSVAVSVISVPGATYMWRKNSVILPGVTTQSYTINSNSIGIYDCIVSVGSCGGMTPPINIGVSSLPFGTITSSVPPIGNLVKICEGDPLSLFAPSGVGYTYQWSSGPTLSNITPTITGNYSVGVTNADGCYASFSIIVQVNSLPSGNISGADEVCQNSNMFLTAPTGSGYSYLWSTGETDQVLQVPTATAGNFPFSVTVTNSNNCVSTFYDTVTVNSIPAANISLNGSASLCEGDNITLTTYPNNANYYWNNGETTQSISVTSGGIYSVTVTKNDCSNSGTSPLIIVNDLPIVHIQPNGAPGSLIANVDFSTGTAPYNYLWTTGATTQSVILYFNGLVGVTVVDANGCSSSDNTTVAGVGIEELLMLAKEGKVDILNSIGQSVARNFASNEFLNSGIYFIIQDGKFLKKIFIK